MTYRTPRCIATPTHHTRCPRTATTHGGLYTCAEHRIPRVLLDMWQSASTRKMLAFATWETLAEGQRLIDEVFNRRAS